MMEYKTNELIKITDEEYFAIEGRASSSASKKILRKSPAHILDEKHKDTESLLVGKVTHHLSLENETFNDNYVVIPEFKPISDKLIEKYKDDLTYYNRTDEYKAQLESFIEENKSRKAISQECYDSAMRMCRAIHSSSLAEKYITDGTAEMTLLTTVNGVPVKIKIDYIKIDHENKHIIVTDLKTCRSASEKKFGSAVYYGDGDVGDYNLQAVFYIEALRQVYPDYTIEWLWCAVEKGDNPQACWYKLSEKAYEDGIKKLNIVMPEWDIITSIGCYSPFRATREVVYL